MTKMSATKRSNILVLVSIVIFILLLAVLINSRSGRMDTSDWIDIDSLIEVSNNDHHNYSYFMNNVWRIRKRKFTEIFISDNCKFIYFTTLKTASRTTRLMIDTVECNFGVNLFSDAKYHKTCGKYNCNHNDIKKMTDGTYFKIIFTRQPINRFESVFNFLYGYVPQKMMYKIYKKYNISIEDDTDLTKYEKEYLLWIKYFYFAIENNIEIMQHNPMKSFVYYQHLQPIYLSLCINMICVKPDFVGKIEYLRDNLLYLNKTNSLNMVIDPKVFNATHKTEKKIISKGLTFKFVKQALLPLCILYWNDFICANYDIPIECQKENNQTWLFPYFCVDIRNNKTKWADPLFPS